MRLAPDERPQALKDRWTEDSFRQELRAFDLKFDVKLEMLSSMVHLRSGTSHQS